MYYVVLYIDLKVNKMNIAEEQKIDKELEKIGGALSNEPVNRWLLYNRLPWNILGTSVLGIMASFMFITTYGRSISSYNGKESTKNAIEVKEADKKAQKCREIGSGVMLLFLASCIFWGCAIMGADKRATKEKKGVQLMLKMKQEYPNMYIDEEQAREVLKSVPDIISKMSAADRIYFDILASGDLKLADGKLFHDMATAILVGHLKNNTEDSATLMNIFKQNSEHYMGNYVRYVQQRAKE